jgi:aminoglycoside phosphotransferase (APT) family kinase protein
VPTAVGRGKHSACAGEGAVGFDAEAVSKWLGGLADGCRPPLSFSRLGSGQSNLTLLVTDAVGQRWVLCRSPLGWPLASAHDVEREYWILSALHTSAVPCPSVLGLPAAAIDSQSVDDLVARALRLADLDGI